MSFSEEELKEIGILKEICENQQNETPTEVDETFEKNLISDLNECSLKINELKSHFSVEEIETQKKEIAMKLEEEIQYKLENIEGFLGGENESFQNK